MDHVGFEPPYRVCDLAWIESTAQEASRRRPGPDLIAGALEHLDLVSVRFQQPRDVRDRALLAALLAVPVMEQQDAQRL